MKANTPQKRMRSVEAGRAVWQSNVELTTAELLVLRALADHADHKFECYPSYDRLAAMTRLSKRQVIRVISKLRDKRQIAIDENAGGRYKSNHYRLLVGENSDTRNSDISNCDTQNSDIVSGNSDSSASETVTFLRGNGDSAMSPEWFEGLREKGLKGTNEAFDEIETIDPEDLLNQITHGTTFQHNDTCEDHGPFVRTGFGWRGWVALAGRKQYYSTGWSHDSGCQGCLAEYQAMRTEHPNKNFSGIPLRVFDLRTPAICSQHGNIILEASLWEYPKEYVEAAGGRVQLMRQDTCLCPHCDADWLYETNVQHDLGLSDEEWERGKKHILKGLDIARGEYAA